MSESFTLTIFCLAMFFGSYLSGLVPLAFSLSESKMRYITVLGAGLLVGTALAVIIPEGVHALYLSELETNQLQTQHEFHSEHKVHGRHLNQLVEHDVKENLLPVDRGEKDDVLPPVHQHTADRPREFASVSGHKHSDTTHSAIGVTLILGFVFMLVVDNFGSRLVHHHGTQILDASGSTVMNKSKASWTTTLGLVVHAAADGIALGAASAGSRFNVEMIVFVAIMLHKAPAAFGLVSFLISDGVDRKRIRRHLLAFALAAPLTAILTYVTLKNRIRDTYSVDSTGLAMLFSAGTFLFVATVHVLPEVQSHYENRQFRAIELLILIIGCCFPIILSMGHQH